MTIAYLLGGQIPLEKTFVTDFCVRFPAVREVFEQAADRTGLETSDLIVGAFDGEGELVQSFGAVRQAALIIGMHDVLADRGTRPDAIGGLSLGGLVSACLAGGLDRQQLFEMLHYQRLIPEVPADSPPQGMAVAALAEGDDIERYIGPVRPGIYLAADYDVVPGGDKRVIVLSGYRAELTALAAEQPRRIRMLEEYVGAFHSPLVQHVADFMAKHVSGMTFYDPKITLCSPHRTGVIQTADEVREFFLTNYLNPVGVRFLLDEVNRFGAESAIGLGPGMPQRLVAEPLILSSVLTADDLANF
ncbi:hypothetical protein ACIRRA_40095 [Nocardia sp. NPDC101769]|uniref:hypothetical protein n=1 Tax=Nocardia sp. NPDC101769 TaxID=3364333 RepID=UPI00380144D6